MKIRQILIFAILFLVGLVNGVLFDLKEGKEVCFQEDLSEDSLLEIHYTCNELKMNQIARGIMHKMLKRGIEIRVKNEKGDEIYYESLQQAEAHLKVTPDKTQPGIHDICFHVKSEFKMFAPKIETRFGVEFNVESVVDISQAQTKSKITDIEKKVRNIQTKVDKINAEHTRYDEREKRFKDTTDSTSRRVFWMGAFQVVTLFMTAVWQIYSLRRFFKKKKIV